MSFKSRLQAFAVKLVAGALVGDKGHKASDSLGTLHFADFVPFEHNHIGFFTVFDGDMDKYFQDFADKTLARFDALFPHVLAARRPGKNVPRRSTSGERANNYPAIGSYSAYPASRSKTSKPCWPITASQHRLPPDSTNEDDEHERRQRSHLLPIRRPAFSGTVRKTLAGSQPDCPWSVTRRRPEGAPLNVLLVLIDDAGFGNPSTFVLVQTPNYTRLAQGDFANRVPRHCAKLADTPRC